MGEYVGARVGVCMCAWVCVCLHVCTRLLGCVCLGVVCVYYARSLCSKIINNTRLFYHKHV